MNNPAAFPRPLGQIDDLTCSEQDGMTLRDYFAAAAPPIPDNWHEMASENATYVDDLTAMCLWRFQYADAMLKAREA